MPTTAPPSRPGPDRAPAPGRRALLGMTVLALAATTVLTAAAAGPAAAAAATPIGNDVDGVAMMYPTKAGGQEWRLDDNPAADDQLDGPALKRNPDGTFKVTEADTRLGVLSATYDHDDEDDLVWSQPTLRRVGYQHDASDWRDVELTGYVRLNKTSNTDEEFTWYARGARHTGNGDTPETCWGTAYKANLRYRDGATRWQKELFHDGGDGYASGSWQHSGASVQGKLVGFKAVMFNTPTGVRMETYLDRSNTNTWTAVASYDDQGGWAIDEDNRCGGTRDEVVRWGGPIATLRWDLASDVDVTRLSVREIDPRATCNRAQPVAGVSANTYEAVNPPQNAVDGNLTTRWSGYGSGAYLTVDLGTRRTICGAGVAWHRGNLRWNDYTIYTSVDNVTYVKAWEGRSSGTTLQPEVTGFPARQARYVKYAWWNNAEGNGWASITEVTALSA
ncbi:discoidin domain-containing protein [Dactylosporangium sp. NPDC000521]|uniref:discoidin domain-containing protein n=1 Tax=Dactylosporangium sp. NPDC000521 TaxID=3363975 RepID=UPI0036C8F57F